MTIIEVLFLVLLILVPVLFIKHIALEYKKDIKISMLNADIEYREREISKLEHDNQYLKEKIQYLEERNQNLKVKNEYSDSDINFMEDWLSMIASRDDEITGLSKKNLSLQDDVRELTMMNKKLESDNRMLKGEYENACYIIERN